MNTWESLYVLGRQCKLTMVEELNSLVKLVLTCSKYLCGFLNSLGNEHKCTKIKVLFLPLG